MSVVLGYITATLPPFAWLHVNVLHHTFSQKLSPQFYKEASSNGTVTKILLLAALWWELKVKLSIFPVSSFLSVTSSYQWATTWLLHTLSGNSGDKLEAVPITTPQYNNLNKKFAGSIIYCITAKRAAGGSNISAGALFGVLEVKLTRSTQLQCLLSDRIPHSLLQRLTPLTIPFGRYSIWPHLSHPIPFLDLSLS